MFSTRWTISALVLSLLLVQLVSASHIDPSWRRNASPDHDLQKSECPDTNAGKEINKGDRPQNRACKKWFGIRDVILRDIFGGECGNAARAAVRLAFHDAGTFSLRLQRQGRRNGGADGSMLIDPEEIKRPENRGLEEIVAALKPYPEQFGVSHADFLHVAGILGVIICPGGPLIETYIGRKDAKHRSPTGMLPDVRDSVEKMIARFADMGFNVRDLMALIGAHSTARQRNVDPSQAGKSQDSTPDVWDVKFYGETLNSTTPDGVFKFESDVKFAHHPTSRRDFAHFVDNQDDWDEDYASAHERMSLLGVDKRGLIRCTEILPPKIDLGPFFVDREAGIEPDAEDLGEVDDEAEDVVSPGPTIDREAMNDVLKELRGYWGYHG